VKIVKISSQNNNLTKPTMNRKGKIAAKLVVIDATSALVISLMAFKTAFQRRTGVLLMIISIFEHNDRIVYYYANI
jgi:hypothetical protein